MGDWKADNQNVAIGDIFVRSVHDECGSYSKLYKVTGKRGKTLVEIRQIGAEPYIDETCDRERGDVRLRPIPEEIVGESRLTRAYIDGEGSIALYEVKQRDDERYGREYFYPLGSQHAAYRSGWYGFDYWEKNEQGRMPERASINLLDEVLP